MLNYKETIKQLPNKLYKVLKHAGEIGDVLGIKVYVVGGFVRDLILKEKNFDIDLVVEGDGIFFAQKLNEKIKGYINVYDEFGTASIELKNDIIDIVTARSEYYQYPAALPTVKMNSIWHDLYRRDFTINSMAIKLNSLEFGNLLDYFGGLTDIKNRVIRVHHSSSFTDDPTRILRIIRFAGRLNFTIEEKTKQYMQKALEQNMILKISDDRIRKEIIHILEEKSFSNIISIMECYGIFQNIDPNLIIKKDTIKKLHNLETSICEFSKYTRNYIDKNIIKIMHILESFPLDKLSNILTKFVSDKKCILTLIFTLTKKKDVYIKIKNKKLDKYDLYKILEPYSIESLIFYYNDCENYIIKDHIRFYVKNLKDIKIDITGKDLKSLNIKPGPIYAEILNNVLKAKILGEVDDYIDEINYVKKFYNIRKNNIDT
ncbi:MAG: CCA tRNA nucleotidyltransferase [Clostridiales bacterium]|nr:CCA tRNA nucleotidyltransferase [Clostridiales bacterium]